MKRDNFQEFLRERMGLDVASIGAASVDKAVRSRMSACGDDTDAYWARLQASATEAQELIEAVVVPETWFFRDRDAIAAMTHIARTQWPNGGGPRRLLSLPCATGEEPYSLAIALFDIGLTGKRFRVDAIDISARALRRAAAATYGRNSFRGGDLGFRDQHFEQTPEGYRVSQAVRDCVQFTQANIFEPGFLPGAETYDVIFCRNMLIYFDRDAQDRAVRVLARLLAPSGCLFVGPSETSLLRRSGFEPMATPRASAFRKAPPVAAPSPDKRAAVLPKVVARLRPAAGRPGPAPAKAAVAPPAPNFDDIKRLADGGQFEEAIRRCDAHIGAHGASADALCLMGLIQDSKNAPDKAEPFYRKALYLEPAHREALLHLSLLLERKGDARGAGALNGRIARLGGRAAM